MQYSESTAGTRQTIAVHNATTPPTPFSPTKSAGSQSWRQGFGQSQYSPRDVVNTLSPPTQENISAAPPLPPDIQPLHSSSQKHVSTSQSSPSRIPAPPDKLHLTLFRWIKKTNKLSGVIDRLQKLASAAPPENRSQLSTQAIALVRARLKTQREHCMELLQLCERNANRYLLDVDTEIQQQSEFLDKLEWRLEAAEKLRGEAVELQRFYESRTAATMRDLRVTALPRPLPEDYALFREVDSALIEIMQCYTELYKFWTEEISRALEAFEKRRVSRTDFERWRNFHKQTIESGKGELPSGDAQTVLRNNACSSSGANIGTIASSLSSAMSSVTSALERLPSTNSLKHMSSCQSSIRRVYLALRGNRDLCLSFLRRCADYGEKVIGCRLSSTDLSAPFRVMASYDIRERIVGFQSEMTGISTENAANVQGSRKFKAAYKKALCLEEKMNSDLSTLLEKLSSCVMVIDADDTPPDIVTLGQLEERWDKARDSLRAALAILKNEPVPQHFTVPPPGPLLLDP